VIKVKFALEQAMKAQRRSNLGARWRWVVNATPWPLYPRE
jgi:hypothetical protein